MFWATMSLDLPRDLPRLLLGPGLVRLEVRHRLHPLAESLLVVEQVGDPQLGVLVLRAPEQGVERAHLDADAAVHAQRVVDVEPVEPVDLAGLPAGPAGRRRVLVALDVDAPVGAAAGAQHADGAVVFLEGDDAAGAGCGRLLLVRVLDGGRALRRRGDERLEPPGREGGLHHRLQRDAQALHQARRLRSRELRHLKPPWPKGPAWRMTLGRLTGGGRGGQRLLPGPPTVARAGFAGRATGRRRRRQAATQDSPSNLWL